MPTTIQCSGCSRDILRKPYLAKRLKASYCSAECKKRSLNKTFACANCGAACSRYRSQATSKTLYCSEQCRNEHGRIMIPCAWLGCMQTMPAREGWHHGKKVFKIELSKKGAYSERPLCKTHRDLTSRTRVSIHGLTRIWKNVGMEYTTRSISSKAMRLFLFERAGWKCEHCKNPLAWDAPYKTVIIDHRIPVFKGGKTTLSNLQLLCKTCDDIKTASDKSEAALIRHSAMKTGRWLTHYEKDSLIASLRAEISELRKLISH